MVGALALDAQRIWTAPIALGDQALVGAAAVVLPGTTFGKAAILAAGSAAEAGATLAGKPRNLQAFACCDASRVASCWAGCGEPRTLGTVHACPRCALFCCVCRCAHDAGCLSVQREPS